MRFFPAFYFARLTTLSILAALSLSLLLGLSSLILAQTHSTSPIPERRIELTMNTDFFGSDLRNVFEVTFDDCVAVCLADRACKAFTYNTKSAACFPKSAVTERTAFEGATSVEVIDASAQMLSLARAQVEHLGFLPEGFLTSAKRAATQLGTRYPTNGWTYDALMAEAQSREQAGDVPRALELVLAALNDADKAGGWIEAARLAAIAKPKTIRRKRMVRDMKTAAAINGFLRSDNPAQQVNALHELARGLEATRNGKLAIPTLRLAQTLSPRKSTETDLDRLIGLYGFRVTDHKVDHNGARPRICAIFSEELQTAGVEYSDFVGAEISGLTAEADGRQLCIEGVEHGARYRLNLRKGLPAENGEVLRKTVTLNVYVQDRDPSARFAGRAYVLPKRDGASLPLITVNLEKVDVVIYRVGDRNLLRSVQEDLFSKPISRWNIGMLGNDLGQEIWRGTADVGNQLNQEVTTALPIGDALSDFEAGVYAMTARVPGTREDTVATQWFIVSDLGLASMKGNDGLHVFVRSLRSADAVAGATVRLVSRANEVVAQTRSDEQGYARFDAGLALGEGGAAPALVTVETADGDYAFLDQGAAEFDLSDRGVAGRDAPPPIDVFLATDRGAYRPGEVIHTTVLARNHRAEALSGVPITVDLIRPDGVRAARQLVEESGAGGGSVSFDVPPNGARGTWKLRVYGDRKAAALVERRVLVEDFVPEKIDFDLALPEGVIGLRDQPKLRIDARYLYGAVGADLAIEGEVKLSAVTKLAGFDGYHFGPADELFRPKFQSISNGGVTGADGTKILALKLPDAGQVSKPLEMTAVVRLRDGSGRPVERRVSAPVQNDAPMIGIKPLFDGAVAEGTEAVFQVIALGQGMQRRDMVGTRWVINRLQTRYQWYSRYGSWAYEPITRRERIASGDVDISADGTVTISTPVEYGRYELRLEQKATIYAAASYQFNAGWYASGSADAAPDLLDVAVDKADYSVGDKAILRVQSRFDGVAQVSVLTDRLVETRSVAIRKGANEIALDVTDDWGSGAYLAATVVQPMDQAEGQNPSRALGLAFAKVDPAERLLQARFVSEAEASPRGQMDVALQVDGLGAGQPGFVTIAAVDVGVLNLTGFEAPDPADHYFGQRKLGVALRDVYGRLIDGGGAKGRLRSGGDGTARDRMQSPPPSEDVLAEFSGVLTVGADGLVRTSFDLPDFNGTVRLMAVVWSHGGVGQAVQDVLVRDPVVINAYAPRFLTPNDRAEVRVELAHAFGPEGDFEVTIGATGMLDLGAGSRTQTVSLQKGSRKVLTVPLVAGVPGTPRIEVFLKTPDGAVLSKNITVPVQWNDPELARQTRLDLASGAVLQLDGNMLEGFHAGSTRSTLAVGPLAQFDAAGLMTALDRYPYGCTEQTTSRAMPLLYFDKLSEVLGLASKADVHKRVDGAIARVLSNQASNGAFGLWRPASGDLWLNAFVSDFLSRARQQGFGVPDLAFEKALENLRNRVNYAADFEDGGQDIAYALMVLAREGYAAIGDLRYYADTRAEEFATPLAQAQLGAALASYGDPARADRMFRLANSRIKVADDVPVWRTDYGSGLRDAAAVLTLAVDAGSQAIDREVLARQIATVPVARRSTQENLWRLMAVNALAEDSAATSVLLNGVAMAAPQVAPLSEADLASGVAVENTGEQKTSGIVSVFGVPSEPEPAQGQGYVLRREYYTPDGALVALDRVAQNTRLVVVLKVQQLRATQARLMVNDPLPAGFEIDNPNLISGGEVAGMEWLGETAGTEYSEFRTDRFLAAVDWAGRGSFQLAYMVRAVSKGVFHHPAAVVEDMYRPAQRARTATGQVEVTGN